jgi:hypothetical protein
MRYAYEVQPDGDKTVHAFANEASRVEWIAPNFVTRGVLSGNSSVVKGALYRGTVTLHEHPVKSFAVKHS